MAEWTRASEVLAPDEWEELDQLPPSRFREAARDVASRRSTRTRSRDHEAGKPDSRAGRRLRRAERILKKQANGEFPVPGGRLSQWSGMLQLLEELLEVARADKADGQSYRDFFETQAAALQRGHAIVQTLLELCPTTDELLELRDQGMI